MNPSDTYEEHLLNYLDKIEKQLMLANCLTAFKIRKHTFDLIEQQRFEKIKDEIDKDFYSYLKRKDEERMKKLREKELEVLRNFKDLKEEVKKWDT